VLREHGTHLLGHGIILVQEAEQGLGGREAPNDHDDQGFDEELVGIELLPPALAFFDWGRGVGICSTSQRKLTRMLPWVSIAVPPE
jgi:hypothetical protein